MLTNIVSVAFALDTPSIAATVSNDLSQFSAPVVSALMDVGRVLLVIFS
ncbi:hypothetical protein EVJ58_g6232, partial [Rhodofomes roseus]